MLSRKHHQRSVLRIQPRHIFVSFGHYIHIQPESRPVDNRYITSAGYRRPDYPRCRHHSLGSRACRRIRIRCLLQQSTSTRPLFHRYGRSRHWTRLMRHNRSFHARRVPVAIVSKQALGTDDALVVVDICYRHCIRCGFHLARRALSRAQSSSAGRAFLGFIWSGA
jgi:hypothetical protein